LHAPGQFRVVYPAQSIAGDGAAGRGDGGNLIKTFIQCQEKYLSDTHCWQVALGCSCI